MQDGLFFRILRRVNLIMFTLGWIAALCLVSLVVWKHGLPKSLLEKEAQFTPPAEATATAYTLLPEAFDGGMFMKTSTAPSIYVYSRSMTLLDTSLVGFNPYGAGVVVNLMVIDDKGQGHWLFQTNKQQVVSRVAVRKGALTAPVPQASQDVRPVIGLVLEVADEAPAKVTTPQIVTAPVPAPEPAKPGSIWLWKQGTPAAVKLLDKVFLENSEQIGADRFHIVYSDGKVDHVAVYSLPDFEKLSDNALPQPPK